MLPKVLICIAVKNDAKYLPKFLKNFDKLDYPHDKLRFVIMYGKSVDMSLKILERYFSKRDFKYEIYNDPPFKKKIESAAYLAEVCNEFVEKMKDEEYLVIIDSDISSFPPKTLKRLIKEDKDIIAPYVFIEGRKQFFDTTIFRNLEGEKFPEFNPPQSKKPIKVGSVGTFVCIKRRVLDSGVRWENPYPHLQFCKNARKKGFDIWALPSLIVYHADVERDREFHYSLEFYVERGLLPKEELEKVRI